MSTAAPSPIGEPGYIETAEAREMWVEIPLAAELSGYAPGRIDALTRGEPPIVRAKFDEGTKLVNLGDLAEAVCAARPLLRLHLGDDEPFHPPTEGRLEGRTEPRTYAGAWAGGRERATNGRDAPLP